ncbi:hypothetical protein F4556_006531 [Kitasatospora gansuensis]|uniref:Bacterial Ig domain-containing protein n=1 Tax=Kitasatospora gansuensis TaxID=258050 RepID=A0A7W7SKJ0_9ACTN|nr:hypothetical protein [Kitasatospora gansuensis]
MTAELRAVRGLVVELHLPRDVGRPVVTDQAGNVVASGDGQGLRLRIPADGCYRLSFSSSPSSPPSPSSTNGEG